MNFVFIQDVGQQQAVQLSEDEQLDDSVSAGVDPDGGGVGDKDIDATLADEQMDSAVAPSDRVGDNRDTNISSEPTVRNTRSVSKLVPENTLPLRCGRGRGCGQPKSVRRTRDEACGPSQEKESSVPPATPACTPVKKLSGGSDFLITLPPPPKESPLPPIVCRQAKKGPVQP